MDTGKDRSLLQGTQIQTKERKEADNMKIITPSIEIIDAPDYGAMLKKIERIGRAIRPRTKSTRTARRALSAASSSAVTRASLSTRVSASRSSATVESLYPSARKPCGAPSDARGGADNRKRVSREVSGVLRGSDGKLKVFEWNTI